MVFAPHPDDETLACGGTLAGKMIKGENVYIIVMTDGRNAYKSALNIWENPTPEEVKVVRKNEIKEAAKVLGIKVDHIVFLDFEDGTLNDNKAKAKELVKYCLIKLKPTDIFVPQEEDLHQDHSSTNGIVLSAVKELGLDLDVYEYMIWAEEVQFFRDVPKHLHLVEIDISKTFHLKMKAITMYKSQMDILFPSQTRPILEDAFLSNFKKDIEYFLRYRIQKGDKIKFSALTE